ncbi:MAG TPA: glycosyltransferase family 4 protein [Planctomycetota bacterium]|nr:glycosyltransferase family 4 protein [Planctomycetota bacterium]
MSSGTSNGSLAIAQANFHMLWGGQAEVVLALSTALSARGHRVTVITPPESELSKRAAEAGLDVFTGCRFRKGFRPVSFLKDVNRLGALMKNRGTHIYHCHGSQDHWTGVFARNRHSPGTKIVRTRHNIYPIKDHAANRWLFRRQTAQVITIFGEQAKYFTANGLLKTEDLFTLHSPLPQEFATDQPAQRVVRDELKLSPETPLIGFVANFHPDKAPLDFVAAAEKIAAEHKDAQFCMAGHGPLDDEIRARVSQNGLASRFHMLGFRKDIRSVIASFDLLLLTSVTREASSTVLKQAGAVDVPVIATDVGGTREIVEDGKTGIVVKPGAVDEISSAAVSLLKDPLRAKQMGSAGREKVLREFTAAAIAERTEGLYRRLIQCKSKR